MTFHELNILPKEILSQELYKCCGSTTWVNKMISLFPMDDLVELLEDAEELWFLCSEKDWREAFSNHPKIGDRESMSKKFSATTEWESDEQSGVSNAPGEVIADLHRLNIEYEKKFGYIFIVNATGKNAAEILSLLEERLSNAPEDEMPIAADEQNKITSIRLQKLIT